MRKRKAIKFGTTFEGLRAASASRVLRWHGKRGVKDWSTTDWSNAAAGEMGEVCNAVKKLRRIEGQLPNHNTEEGRTLATKEHAINAIGLEMADTIIYLDLLAAKLGINLEQMVRVKFNMKSEEYGFPERLVP